MSTRVVDSKTVLAVGQISPAWDAYDRYRRNSDGGNTLKALRLAGIYTENQYDSSIIFERNEPTKVGTNMNGPYNWTIGGHILGGVPIASPSIPFPDPYDLMGQLESRWKNSDFNAGVFMAEGKEAVSMLGTRLSGLSRAAKALYHRNLGGALREMTGSVPSAAKAKARNRMDLNDLSGAWLELHLGWSPMLGDIYSAAQLLDLRERGNRIKVANFNEGVVTVSGNPDHWIVKGKHRKYQSIIVECKRAATLPESLGLRDPAGVLWEATTLSFVADWFLPIGKSLANAHAVGAVPVEKVIHTNYYVLEGKSFPNQRQLGGLWVDPQHYDFNCYMKTYEVKRRIYDSLFPLIGHLGWLPGSVSPKWDPSLWKLATASALVHQAISQLLHRGK